MKNLFDNLKEKVSERKVTIKELTSWKNKLERELTQSEDLEEARSIFLKAAQVTQSRLSAQISNIVSSALAAVFEEPYTFVVDFVQRRNNTECDLKFEKNNKQYDPLSSCGFGVADVASLALRVAFWKLEGNSRNTLALDEPTRALSLDKHERASMMIQQLSRMKGGLQFLIVTHSQALAAYADRTFKVTKENNISHLTLEVA
jgi:DNA repair exonuclease SbcCD ATPase subunit